MSKTAYDDFNYNNGCDKEYQKDYRKYDYDNKGDYKYFFQLQSFSRVATAVARTAIALFQPQMTAVKWMRIIARYNCSQKTTLDEERLKIVSKLITSKPIFLS